MGDRGGWGSFNWDGSGRRWWIKDRTGHYSLLCDKEQGNDGGVLSGQANTGEKSFLGNHHGRLERGEVAGGGGGGGGNFTSQNAYMRT